MYLHRVMNSWSDSFIAPYFAEQIHLYFNAMKTLCICNCTPFHLAFFWQQRKKSSSFRYFMLSFVHVIYYFIFLFRSHSRNQKRFNKRVMAWFGHILSAISSFNVFNRRFSLWNGIPNWFINQIPRSCQKLAKFLPLLRERESNTWTFISFYGCTSSK